MNINAIFSPEMTLHCGSEITNKKKALEKISNLLSSNIDNLKSHHVLDALQQREKIGSTAFGHGIAIPHARMEALSSAHCAVLQLKKPIDFSSEDSKLVDIIFGLIVPKNYDENHLQILSHLSESLLNEHFRQQLRQTKNSKELYETIIAGNTNA